MGGRAEQKKGKALVPSSKFQFQAQVGISFLSRTSPAQVQVKAGWMGLVMSGQVTESPRVTRNQFGSGHSLVTGGTAEQALVRATSI